MYGGLNRETRVGFEVKSVAKGSTSGKTARMERGEGREQGGKMDGGIRVREGDEVRKRWCVVFARIVGEGASCMDIHRHMHRDRETDRETDGARG